MVDQKSIDNQLKKINFNPKGWGAGEVSELHHIILPDEEIYEVANGIYEGGFALLVATDVRVLLIDKKPLNFLTVEDLRFDQINELDYNHRLFGAYITISSGSKTLRFRSYNQPRLRKLIQHVQHCMAEGKKKETVQREDQKDHLEQINKQLQAYLIAQHEQQEQLRKQLNQQASQDDSALQSQPTATDAVKPSPELSDYLFAQRLLADYRDQNPQAQIAPPVAPIAQPEPVVPPVAPTQTSQERNIDPQMADLYSEGMQEIFGQRVEAAPAPVLPAIAQPQPTAQPAIPTADHSEFDPLDVNILRIAQAKLPLALRNRKFGRPSFHAHSQADQPTKQPTAAVS